MAPDGRVEVGYPNEAGSYYRMLGGESLENLSTPLALTFSGAAWLPEPAGGDNQVFLRIDKLPVSSGTDTDGDGIPDVYELFHPATLNALDPTDAGADPDGNGLTALEEYQAASDREVTGVLATSPVFGETGVSVTRETVVHFTGPLRADAVLSTSGFYAQFGGRQILARVELASDRRKATLFYLEPLPGGARIRVSLEGDCDPYAAA